MPESHPGAFVIAKILTNREIVAAQRSVLQRADFQSVLSGLVNEMMLKHRIEAAAKRLRKVQPDALKPMKVALEVVSANTNLRPKKQPPQQLQHN